MSHVEPKTQSAESQRHPAQNKWGCVSALAAAWVAAALYAAAIANTGGSTAGLGILYVPWIAAVAAFPAFGFGVSLCQVTAWYRSVPSVRGQFPNGAWSYCLLFGGSVAAYVVYGIILTCRVQWARQMSTESIDRLDVAWLNTFVLAALAVNPHTSPEFLDRVSRQELYALYQPLWSVWPVQPDNRWGLSVMRLIARRQDCLPETFRRLASSKHASELEYDVLSNPSTPPELLRGVLTAATRGGRLDLAMHFLAGNEAIPQDLADEVAAKGEPYHRELLAGNEGISESTMGRLALDVEPRVRDALLRNPKCPDGIMLRLKGQDATKAEQRDAADSR